MSGLSLVLVTLALIWGCAFYRLSAMKWTTLVATWLVFISYLGWLGTAGWLIWPLFSGIFIFLYCSPLRLHLISSKLFAWFKNTLPSMSRTEEEALEAGDVWWEKQLFQGTPDWEALTHFASPSLNQEEQAFLKNQVMTLCAMLDDWEITHERSNLPQAVWEYLKKEKFFGMIIPKEFGGLGFSAAAHSAVITKIATRSQSCAVTTMVPNSLGPAELLLHYGTSAQKTYYLPRLANGTDIPCFGLTSLEAGSDAGAIVDEAIICKQIVDGKETIGARLTFDKRYITLAPVATLLGVAVKLYDPEKILSNKQALGITLFLLPANHPGIEIGKRHFPLNMAFLNGPMKAHQIFFPLTHMIGGEKMAGCGWRMLMECLSAGRGISLPALSTGTGMLASKMTGSYAAIRQQFNTPIGRFEGVEEALARIAGLTYLLEATRRFTLIPIQASQKPAIASAIAKYHMTEMARKIINDAMDVHGGRGIMMGKKNYLARTYQGIPVSITVEGANILTRSLIIFGQGALRCHPYLKDELHAVQLSKLDEKKALEKFDKLYLKHIGFILTTFAKVMAFSLTRGIFSTALKNNPLNYYIKKINWLSNALLLTTEMAMFMLGGELKRKERLSARLGDVLSHLYLASAVIKYHHDQHSPITDYPLTKWALIYCLYNAQVAFDDFFQNFPHKGVSFILKTLIFPFGRAFKKPNDKLSHLAASLLLNNNETRERITALCYVSEDPDDPLYSVEHVFSLFLALKTTMDKLTQAIKNKEIDKNNSLEEKINIALSKKIINEQESKLILDYEVAKKKAMSVDEFPFDYPLGTKQC